MNLTIHTLHALKDNFVYVLSDGDDCAVIDPGEAAPVLTFLANHNLRLTHILCTHHHADHVQGVSELVRRFPDAEVWTSEADVGSIPDASRQVSETSDLRLLNQPLRVLAIPGHTLGQVAFWLPTLAALFPGDTLFSCGCGRLFEGTFEQMFASLAKIKALPAQTQIYFGHEYTLRNVDFVLAEGARSDLLLAYKLACENKIRQGQDTTPCLLATELEINPFLKVASADEFRQWRERRDLW